MKIPKEEENDDGKTVVVGVKMDPESRELLTWALVKVALTGDRVIALHVIPADGEVASLLSLVKAFDSILAVYDGFCNLKQIDLKLKLCRGSSIRKVLVRETRSAGAAKLILGVSKNHHGIRRSSTSIAKYCSKKLPRSCSILAVKNGKIAFQRESLESNNSHYLLAKRVDLHRPSFHCFPSVSKARPKDGDYSSWGEEGKDENSMKSNTYESPSLVPVKKPEAQLSSSPAFSVRESLRPTPGWPLLQKAVITDKKVGSQEKIKSSVVQWAMRLPNQYTAVSSVVHPDRKHAKYNESAAPMSVVENQTIITDSSFSFKVHQEEKELPEGLKSLQEKYSSVCRLFSFKELKHITSDFSSDNLIGKGGSSRVYKGCLSDGKELAVKVLKPYQDAWKEFVSDIEIITDLHHKNIISLLGFCYESGNLMLVYDFLSRGSLEENLHGENDKKTALNWAERYKIALGVAEALHYLHGGGSAEPVIHRDVKSSNILLSEDFEPLLSDFGLAQRASSSLSHATCNDVAGTFGYLAPEYFMFGKVNEKIDIYAFGVVLLELLSGRKPVSSGCPKGEESLVRWAEAILHGGKVKQLVDPCLADKHDDEQMECMILAASLCIKRSPRSRPPMALVMKLLQGDAEVLKWVRSQVNDASEEFNEPEDEEKCPDSAIQSYINLAFLDVDDDTHSVISTDPSVDFIAANTSLQDYLKGRWSRTSSFD